MSDSSSTRRATLRFIGIAAVGLIAGGVAIALVPASRLFVTANSSDERTEAGVKWVCPMLDYSSDHRGDGRCPVCGMTLERISAGVITAAQAERMGVATVAIAAGPARVTIRAYGAARFDPRASVLVTPRISGRVVRRHQGALHHGEVVAAGAPLVDLYSPEAFTAQADLAAAVRGHDDALVSALSQRFTAWNLTSVAAAITAGGAPQDTVTITSPARGVAQTAMRAGAAEGSAELPAVGTELMAGTALLELVDDTALMVVVHVPEVQARFLRLGQPVQISSDDAGELPHIDARISWMAPELNAEIRAREIHLHVHDPSRQLLAGALVLARIQAALSPTLTAADPDDAATWGTFPLVPKSAVLATGVRQVAWKLASTDADGHQRFVPVALALGPRLEDAGGDDRYVVRAGLVAGDVVATQGAFLIDAQAQLAGSPSLMFPAGAQ